MHRFFYFFKNLLKHVWSLQFHTFNGFRPSKTSHFPTRFSSIFYAFPKSFPGTVFRGSRCRSFLHLPVLVPFSIFGVSEKAPLGRHFRVESRLSVTRRSRAERPGADPAPNDLPKLIFTDFSRILGPSGPFLSGFCTIFRSFRERSCGISFLHFTTLDAATSRPSITLARQNAVRHSWISNLFCQCWLILATLSEPMLATSGDDFRLSGLLLVSSKTSFSTLYAVQTPLGKIRLANGPWRVRPRTNYSSAPLSFFPH